MKHIEFGEERYPYGGSHPLMEGATLKEVIYNGEVRIFQTFKVSRQCTGYENAHDDTKVCTPWKREKIVMKGDLDVDCSDTEGVTC